MRGYSKMKQLQDPFVLLLPSGDAAEGWWMTESMPEEASGGSLDGHLKEGMVVVRKPLCQDGIHA